MSRPLQRLSNAAEGSVPFTWNGRNLYGRPNDTIASALYASGIRRFGVSRRYHEARGLSGSFVAGHLATVDGIPHCRLDRMPLAAGARVQMQGCWPTPRFDVLRCAGWLPRRALWAGFEHARAIPDHSPLWRPWERFLARAAGEAEAPPRGGGLEVAGRRQAVRTVVVGGGTAGIAAAKASGPGTVLISRGEPREALPEHLTVLPAHEVFACYDEGRVVAAAPFDPGKPVTLFDTRDVVLATGLRSIPPLVRGAALPGVLDSKTAVTLARVHGVPAGAAVVVVGTAGRDAVAQELGELGVNVTDTLPVESLRAILGRKDVEGVDAGGRKIVCDAVVHAGPWRTDPSLVFQAAAGGELRLEAAKRPAQVRFTGSAQNAPEPIQVGAAPEPQAYVCPCMDVTVGEVLHHIAKGTTHVEELKRLTACGMGPCQGLPCWDLLAAVVAFATGKTPEEIGHPTYRAPRGALTFGQAAGLADLTEVAP